MSSCYELLCAMYYNLILANDEAVLYRSDILIPLLNTIRTLGYCEDVDILVLRIIENFLFTPNDYVGMQFRKLCNEGIIRLSRRILYPNKHRHEYTDMPLTPRISETETETDSEFEFEIDSP